MTREEKLHWLNVEIQTWENDCQSKHPIKEALYAARKALEQEPTTKNDLGVDCVSRQAVDSLACEYLTKATDESIAFYEHFLELPSVTPQEPRKIKVLDRDEVSRKLGTVDIYTASAWITLLKDLDYLGMKICEVEE